MDTNRRLFTSRAQQILHNSEALRRARNGDRGIKRPICDMNTPKGCKKQIVDVQYVISNLPETSPVCCSGVVGTPKFSVEVQVATDLNFNLVCSTPKRPTHAVSSLDDEIQQQTDEGAIINAWSLLESSSMSPVPAAYTLDEIATIGDVSDQFVINLTSTEKQPAYSEKDRKSTVVPRTAKFSVNNSEILSPEAAVKSSNHSANILDDHSVINAWRLLESSSMSPVPAAYTLDEIATIGDVSDQFVINLTSNEKQPAYSEKDRKSTVVPRTAKFSVNNSEILSPEAAVKSSNHSANVLDDHSVINAWRLLESSSMSPVPAAYTLDEIATIGDVSDQFVINLTSTEKQPAYSEKDHKSTVVPRTAKFSVNNSEILSPKAAVKSSKHSANVLNDHSGFGTVVREALCVMVSNNNVNVEGHYTEVNVDGHFIENFGEQNHCVMVSKNNINVDGHYTEVNVDGRYTEVNVDGHFIENFGEQNHCVMVSNNNVNVDGRYTEVNVDGHFIENFGEQNHCVMVSNNNVNVDGHYTEVNVEGRYTEVNVDGHFIENFGEQKHCVMESNNNVNVDDHYSEVNVEGNFTENFGEQNSACDPVLSIPQTGFIGFFDCVQVSQNSDQGVNSFTEENTSRSLLERSRNRQKMPAVWKSAIRKRLRNSGESYITRLGVVKREKLMKPGCGVRCRLKCQSQVSFEQRESIFHEYWNLGDLVAQRSFIVNHVETVRGKDHKSNKRPVLKYTLTVEGQVSQVCKTMFLNTLSVSDQVVLTTLKKITSGGHLQGESRRLPSNRRLSETLRQGIRDHINKFPTVESHYCRKDSQKRYLPQELTLLEMFRLYQTECFNVGIAPVKKWFYFDVFKKDFNLSFHVPKKDQCDLCQKYANVDMAEKTLMCEQIEEHIKNKTLSRKLKECEKVRGQNDRKLNVACFDLQQVLITPKTMSSQLFYRRKLATYKLTVYEMVQKLGHCYMWHEGVGKRGATNIASCIWKYINDRCSEAVCNEFVFFTDNCGGQNKNKLLISMYLHAVRTLGIDRICHNYLERGHTENEGDSMHAVIERASKRANVYSPMQWYTLAGLAKKQGQPYSVIEMEREMMNFKPMCTYYCNSLVDEVTHKSPQWTKIKCFMVEKNYPNCIFVKYSFEQIEFNKVVIGGGNDLATYESIPFMDRETCITNAKKADLLYMCRELIIPKQHHEFYNGLTVISQESEHNANSCNAEEVAVMPMLNGNGIPTPEHTMKLGSKKKTHIRKCVSRVPVTADLPISHSPVRNLTPAVKRLRAKKGLEHQPILQVSTTKTSKSGRVIKAPRFRFL